MCHEKIEPVDSTGEPENVMVGVWGHCAREKGDSKKGKTNGCNSRSIMPEDRIPDSRWWCAVDDLFLDAIGSEESQGCTGTPRWLDCCRTTSSRGTGVECLGILHASPG